MIEDLPLLPERPPESHKGNFGFALVVGGSRGHVGGGGDGGNGGACAAGRAWFGWPCPSLASRAWPAFEPSYMTTPLPADRAGRIALAARPKIVSAAEWATVVAYGPGMGRSPGWNRSGRGSTAICRGRWSSTPTG